MKSRKEENPKKRIAAFLAVLAYSTFFAFKTRMATGCLFREAFAHTAVARDIVGKEEEVFESIHDRSPYLQKSIAWLHEVSTLLLRTKHGHGQHSD